MFRTRHWIVLSAVVIYLITAAVFTKVTAPVSNEQSLGSRTTVIIDPGHGGEDGGATSCSGVLESKINLEISVRLNHLMHLLGYQTVMTRTEDISIYTEGTTLSQKKVSDLKERVRIANTTNNAVLISIHQNQYPDSRYYGAQVFYAPTNSSKKLAEGIQSVFISTINQSSRRSVKSGDGIYLMQKVTCPAVLIECGFLSNYEEEALLRQADYQLKICAVIATSAANSIENILLT